MNPINSGVLANIIVLTLLILMSTGWFRSTVEHIGVRSLIILYFIFIFFAFLIDLDLKGVRINAGGFLFPLAGFIILWLKLARFEKIQMGLASVLLGSSYFLIKELLYLDPVLLILEESYQITILLLFIVIGVSLKPNHQIMLLFGGSLFGDLMFQLRHRHSFAQLELGSREMRDILWLSILSVVLLNAMFPKLFNFLKKKKIKFVRIR